MILRTPQNNLKITCPECHQKLDVSGLETFAATECPSCECSMLVPRRFSQYLLEEPLSETKMAEVFRALDLKLQREIAVKIAATSHHRAEDSTGSFLRAARQTARLNHHNVVPIYSCGEYEGLPYLVMEFLDDGSLADHLHEADNGIGVAKSLHAVIQAARGLHAANQVNVLHGHVCPANILLTVEGDVKVADFGVALALKEKDRPLDELHYASPELLKNDAWDHRSDIYALGGSLYHALTGYPPFGNDYGTRMKDLYSRPQVSLHEVRPDLPGNLNEFLCSCLAPAPEDRPPSYNSVLKTLTHVAHDIEHSTVKMPAPSTSRSRGKGIRFTGSRVSPIQRRAVDSRSTSYTFLRRLILFVAILTAILLLAHGATQETTWYVEYCRPVVRWITVHVHSLIPGS